MRPATWYRSTSDVSDRLVRRKSPRVAVNIPGLLMAEDKSLLGRCTMLDVSEGGARLQAERTAELPATLILVLSKGARTVRYCAVRWRSDTEIGVEFLKAPVRAAAEPTRSGTPEPTDTETPAG